MSGVCIAQPVIAAAEPELNSFDPDDLLGELFRCCMENHPLPSLVRHWLVKGILESLRKGEPLDQRLGLCGPGLPVTQHRILLLQRDLHLIAALSYMALADDVTDWQRCLRLAQEIQSFTQRTWPRARKFSEPDHHWPAFKKSLWHASMTGIALPTSAGSLRRILLKNAGCSWNDRGGKLLANFI